MTDKYCIMCDDATTSVVWGQIGDTVGHLCADCAYWCDGNVIHND